MHTKPRIIQHVASFEKIGGPSSQLRLLLGSRLTETYEFKVVSQNRPARGINVPLILEMAQEMRQFRPDLVHVRGLQNEGLHGVLAAHVANCKSIVSVHGFGADALARGPISRTLFERVLEPITLQLAGGVYCVCQHAANRPIIRQYARKNYGVIHNGIDIRPLKPQNAQLRQQLGAAEQATVALYVGRISRDKGLFVLADALQQMQNPPIVWFVGDGPDMDALTRQLNSLVASNRVKFLGRRQDIPELLSACNFFLFPTLHENLSNAVLEAMHAERAVIATDVGGNPEVIIHEKTGRLIAPNDAMAVAHAIEALSAQPKVCVEMGRAGRKRVEEHFSLQQTVDQVSSVYNDMIEQGQKNAVASKARVFAFLK